MLPKSNKNGFLNTSRNVDAGNIEIYDIPKPATPINYDLPQNIVRRVSITTTAIPRSFMDTNGGLSQVEDHDESYDVPRPLNSSSYSNHIMQQHQYNNTLTPSSSNSSLLTSDSLSLSFSSSNRSSLASTMPDYDVPRRNPAPVHRQLLQHNYQLQPQQNIKTKQKIENVANNYDFPMPTGVENSHQIKILPLQLSSALDTLAKLQYETTNTITRLLSFVCPDWRLPDKLEPQLMDIKLASIRMRAALHDLTEFGEGALANAQRSEDRNLSAKLRPLVRAIFNANKLICVTGDTIEFEGGWTLAYLARANNNICHNNTTQIMPPTPDSLDQLIACAQTLTEDVRQITSFIQGNASLLFRRHPTELLLNTNNCVNYNNSDNNSSDWLEDYDYVSFESKDTNAKKKLSLREAISPHLKNKFDNVLKLAEQSTTSQANTTNSNSSLTTIIKQEELMHNDKLLVRYYAMQISTHMGSLRQAIDSFLETVERNQPPKFFIAYGKFVVVSGHNLVTIGDIVHRNVTKLDLRDKILQCTNSLTDALRTCVNKSKKAAAHFPSVTAVQEMVDSVVDISHLASNLKTIMLQAVQLTL